MVEPQFNPAQPPPRKILNLPSHINAQGSYARAALKLLDGLLPDLTDLVSRPLIVEVADTSRCMSPASLPTYSGRPAVDWSHTHAVVARGIRQRWPAVNGGESLRVCDRRELVWRAFIIYLALRHGSAVQHHKRSTSVRRQLQRQHRLKWGTACVEGHRARLRHVDSSARLSWLERRVRRFRPSVLTRVDIAGS